MRKDKEPDAYGLLDEGDVWYATPFRCEAERVLTQTGDTDSEIVAMYRQPTLTTADREAAEYFAQWGTWPAAAKHAEELRGLLDRLGDLGK